MGCREFLKRFPKSYAPEQIIRCKNSCRPEEKSIEHCRQYGYTTYEISLLHRSLSSARNDDFHDDLCRACRRCSSYDGLADILRHACRWYTAREDFAYILRHPRIRVAQHNGFQHILRYPSAWCSSRNRFQDFLRDALRHGYEITFSASCALLKSLVAHALLVNGLMFSGRVYMV